jgi:2'-5' RNA ligase
MQHEFGFWIFPEGDFAQEAAEIIHFYSKQYGFPEFPPHLTLHPHAAFDESRIAETVRAAMSDFQPFAAALGPVEFSTTYFQCVFARVKTTAVLLDVHEALKNALGYQQQNVYMPHVSLVYGDLKPSVKEKIAHDIQLKNTGFSASQVTITRNGGSPDPKDWEVFAQIPFGK